MPACFRWFVDNCHLSIQSEKRIILVSSIAREDAIAFPFVILSSVTLCGWLASRGNIRIDEISRALQVGIRRLEQRT